MSTGFRCQQPGRYRFEKDLCPACAAERQANGWPIVATIDRGFRCADCEVYIRKGAPPAGPRVTYRKDADPRDTVEFDVLLEKLARESPPGRRVRIPSSDHRAEEYRRGLLARSSWPGWSIRRLAKYLGVSHPTAAKALRAPAPDPGELRATALGDPPFEIPEFIAIMLPKYALLVLREPRPGKGWEIRIGKPSPGPYPVSPKERAIAELCGLVRKSDKLPSR